uniref:Uncharacterized protein n=1 Tax=Leersia perrieri TaxID=77586 RepID=A0A0D9VLL4_9ORYZ
MARNDGSGVAGREVPGAGAERAREPAVADVRRRGQPMLRHYAFQLMLLGATAIIGAPVSLSRLFLALVIWLVGCLSLFMAWP